MIRTKAYLLREIAQLKKKRKKLIKELEFAKSAQSVSKNYFKKTVPIISREIENITVKIETLHWCANTSEKRLPKIKNKKKKEDKKDKEKKE